MSEKELRPIPLLTPNYAPASLDLPWYRKQSFRRALFVLALLCIAFTISYIYRDLPEVLKFRRLQNKCMEYTAPQDQIVYSELASDIEKLPKTSPEYWLDLSATQPNVLLRPSCWVKFQAAISGSPPVYPILFLGDRTVDGEQKLVCIYFKGWADNVQISKGALAGQSVSHGLLFEVYLWSKPAHKALPPLTGSRGFGVMGVPPGFPSLRFFAGQRDPTDASRFTIPYEANGKPGVIVAEVTSTRFRLQAKSGPLSPIVPGPNAIR